MNRDQKLIAEAYQKVLEGGFTQDQYGDVKYEPEASVADERNFETNKRLQDDARYKKDWLLRKWTLTDPKSISSLKSDIEKSAPSARIVPSHLKPGDKQSQDFINSLAEKELSNNLDILKQVNPDKILQAYRNEVDPGIQKAEAERETQQQAQNLKQRSSATTGMSETIKKLEQVGFKRGQTIKDEQGVRVVPMSKTIGSLLGGRQNKTVTVNPDGTIFKGQDVDSWLAFGSGKHFAQGKKSLF